MPNGSVLHTMYYLFAVSMKKKKKSKLSYLLTSELEKKRAQRLRAYVHRGIKSYMMCYKRYYCNRMVDGVLVLVCFFYI